MMSTNDYGRVLCAGLLLLLGLGQSTRAELSLRLPAESELRLAFVARAGYRNDQRIQWSGLESTFGVEGELSFQVERKAGRARLRLEGEFFLRQPFGKNVLQDENRELYQANFSLTPFLISRLNLQWQGKKWRLLVGKMATPFGNAAFCHASNDLAFAAPFIRSECILWRETGVAFRYQPGRLVLDLAVVNGEEELDTNSSKAGIVRLGLAGKSWQMGLSAKFQDGIGSEQQKQYRNHAGFDFLFSFGRWQVSAEAIYDQYGFRHPFPSAEIFWPRSLYYRDIFYKPDTPVHGYGGYVNIGYRSAAWSVDANFGYYAPQKIGNHYHDQELARCILYAARIFRQGWLLYGLLLLESDRQMESWASGAQPWAGMLGLEFHL